MTNSFQKLLKTVPNLAVVRRICHIFKSRSAAVFKHTASSGSLKIGQRRPPQIEILNRFSAFSLIEISVVILIIGILVAGVTQSSKLIKYSRLNSARSLTQSSPVAGISDLMLWYETSLESSFLDAEQTDGSTISTWYDNNPQSTVKNDASLNNGDGGTACAGNPIFYESVFNGGIPAVRFDGVNDCLRFSGSDLVGTSYTIFVVEQRRASTDSTNRDFFIGGTALSSGQNLHFGYFGDMYLKFSHYSSDLQYLTIPTYTSPTPRIHTAILNTASSVSGKNYWLNGGTSVDATQSTNTALTSYVGSALGRYSTTSFFIGDLAEIIFYTRALKTEERQAVEAYLSKKYAIAIN